MLEQQQEQNAQGTEREGFRTLVTASRIREHLMWPGISKCFVRRRSRQRVGNAGTFPFGFLYGTPPLLAVPRLPHILVMPGTHSSHTVNPQSASLVSKPAPVCFLVASLKPSLPRDSKRRVFVLLLCFIFIHSRALSGIMFTNGQAIFIECMYPFIQQILIEPPPCVRHCFRLWR